MVEIGPNSGKIIICRQAGAAETTVAASGPIIQMIPNALQAIAAAAVGLAGDVATENVKEPSVACNGRNNGSGDAC